jgi:hypothetical protein
MLIDDLIKLREKFWGNFFKHIKQILKNSQKNSAIRDMESN